MADNNIQDLMRVVMENLKKMADVNTIVGDAVQSADGTTVIPVSKVSFGFGVGGTDFETGKDEPKSVFGGGAGGGVSISPVAFLVMGSEQIKLLPVGEEPTATGKIIDAVPEIFGKLNNFISDMRNKKKDKEENPKEKKNDDSGKINIIIED